MSEWLERLEANGDEAKRILGAMSRRPFRKNKGDQIRRQEVVVPGVGVLRCSVVIRGNNDIEFWLKEYDENDSVSVFDGTHRDWTLVEMLTVRMPGEE